MQTFTSIRDIVEQNSSETLKEHELSQFDLVLEKAGLDEYFADLQKAIDANPLHKTELLEKGRKDLSKLVQKTVTDKRGHQRKVWVKVDKDAAKPKQKKASSEKDSPASRSSFGNIKSLVQESLLEMLDPKDPDYKEYHQEVLSDMQGAKNMKDIYSILDQRGYDPEDIASLISDLVGGEKSSKKSEPKAELDQPSDNKTSSSNAGVSQAKEKAKKAELPLLSNIKDPAQRAQAFVDRHKIKNATIDKDGTIHVKGDVKIKKAGSEGGTLGVQFGKVDGNFVCSIGKLTSLKGVPTEVGGDFDCYNNRLSSLEGAPQKVGGNFICERNRITSLKGCPQKVGGSLECGLNRLTSLEGCPKEIGRSLDCNHNRLTSLKGAPQKLEGSFNCFANALTSLDGSPQEIKGDFGCGNNTLTNLKGGPQKVGKNFGCSSTGLTSLEGAPTEVGGDFSCGSNRLSTLEGAPKEVGGNFSCSNNKLTSLKGGPEKVGKDFYAHGNKITSLDGAPKQVGRDFGINQNQGLNVTEADVRAKVKVGERVLV